MSNRGNNYDVTSQIDTTDSQADTAGSLIQFTGYEKSVTEIRVPSSICKLLGAMLGSGDIITQMADRCYLEKYRDRLYPEFVVAGIATKRVSDGKEEIVYASGQDLLMKTSGFFAVESKRLNVDLGGCYAYAQQHFGGPNWYVEELNKNVRFVKKLSHDGGTSMLRRNPLAIRMLQQTSQ